LRDKCCLGGKQEQECFAPASESGEEREEECKARKIKGRETGKGREAEKKEKNREEESITLQFSQRDEHTEKYRLDNPPLKTKTKQNKKKHFQRSKKKNKTRENHKKAKKRKRGIL